MATHLSYLTLSSAFRAGRRLETTKWATIYRTRSYSDYKPTRYQPQTPSATDESSVQAEFRDGFANVASFYSRFFKYTTISLFSFLFLLYGGYEGAHQWVERVELAALPSPADDPYGWRDELLERWHSADGRGGTDPRLGYRGRHAVRAAWMAMNWSGDSSSATVIESSTAAAAGGSNPFDTQLRSAHTYLSAALRIAQSKASATSSPHSFSSHADELDDRIQDPTVAELSALKAVVLARIGSPEALALAKPLLRGAIDYHTRSQQITRAAQLSTKLGDICLTLKERDEAVGWWMKAVKLLDPELIPLLDDPSRLSQTSIQINPSQQRILMSGLIPLSGHYASTSQYDAALRIQALSFRLLGSFLQSTAIFVAPQSPDLSLHQAALLHRAALLRIHASEVGYAKRRAEEREREHAATTKGKGWFSKKTPISPSMEGNSEISGLQSAARASEYVVEMLTSEPNQTHIPKTTVTTSILDVLGLANFTTTEATGPLQWTTLGPTPDPKIPLLAQFSSSPILSKPAKSYLRQAKRSAAESLKLVGVLLELQPQQSDPTSTITTLSRDVVSWHIKDRDVEALENYERALAWVGGGPDGRAGEDVMEREWKDIWDRYVRMRAKVMGEDDSAAS